MAALAMGLSGIDGSKAYSSAYILSMRDESDMTWIAAGTVAAEMVTFEASENRPDQMLIGPPVRSNNALLAISADLKRPISQWVASTDPLPAATFKDVNLRPEAKGKFGAKMREHRKVAPFGVVQPDALRGVAAAFIIPAQGGLLIWPPQLSL